MSLTSAPTTHTLPFLASGADDEPERVQQFPRHSTEPPELTVDQALPTLAHAVDRHTLIERAARHGADRSIHAPGITTTREDRDVLHELKNMAASPCSPLNRF